MTQDVRPGSLSKPRFAALLLAIVALGGVLRFVGVEHGIDLRDPRLAIWNDHNDEETQALAVRDHHRKGDFDPSAFWLWGAGGFYTYGGLDRLVLPGLAWALDADVSADGLAKNLSPLLLSHRIGAILASLLAIALLGLILRRDFGDRVALLSSFLLATAYLATREAHYGTLDQWLLLGTVVTLGGALRLLAAPTLGRAIVAGAFAGVFASFKYSGGAFVPLLFLGIVLGCGAPGRRLRRAIVLGLASGIAAGVGYLAMSPPLLRSLAPLFDGIHSQMGMIGFRLDHLGEMAAYHLTESLFVGAGEFLIVAAVWGFVLVFSRVYERRAEGNTASPPLLLLSFLIASFLFPLSNTCHSVRQALPIFPSIAILAAIAVERVSSAVRFRSSIAVIAVIVALPSLVRAIALDRLLTQKDTRVDALEFLANSGIPPQQVVGVGFYGLPRSSCIAVRPPFMDWVDAVHRRRVLTRDSAATLKPRLLIRDLSSGLVDEFAWVDFASIAETEYDVVLRGEGRRDGATLDLPDLIHGTPFHFIPYAKPWTMTRPGPSYVIYERR